MSVKRPCPALFVTGTDTGVGKTYVAAALAHFLTRRGLRVGVMKPAESGVDDPSRLGPDAELLQWAAAASDPPELVAPYRLKAPLAPAQAASMEKITIDSAAIGEKLAELTKDKDFVILEGAGGLMAPLRGGFLMADLVRQLDLPLLIVAQTGLGTINHTLLTVYAAQTMGLTVSGILLNGMSENPDLAAREAPKQLAMIASADLLGVMPQVGGDKREAVQRLSEHIEQMNTMGWLLQAIGLGQMNGKLHA